VLEVAQAPKPQVHDAVAAPAVHVHDEGDAAGVVFELGPVKAKGRR
jgi:hypothetical protein